MAKNDRILADERPLEHFLAILAHFMPIIIASNCCQMAKNDRILADERPLEHFLAILAHFMPIILLQAIVVRWQKMTEFWLMSGLLSISWPF